MRMASNLQLLEGENLWHSHSFQHSSRTCLAGNHWTPLLIRGSLRDSELHDADFCEQNSQLNSAGSVSSCSWDSITSTELPLSYSPWPTPEPNSRTCCGISNAFTYIIPRLITGREGSPGGPDISAVRDIRQL